MKAFGRVLRQAILSRGWSLRAAAAPLGVSHSLLGMIVAGRRRPPLDRLVAWRVPLQLDDAAFERFVEAALSAHAGPSLARWLRQLDERARAAEARIDRLEEPQGQRQRRVAEPGSDG